jgi:hypothetical protein
LLKRLIASGVIERRTPGGHVILRFNLDPAAEYLAAIRRLVDTRTKRAGPKEWESYFSYLKETEDYPKEPEGYLTALTTCYRAYERELSLPDVIFPWEETAEPTSSNSASPPQKSATAAPRRPRRAKS